MTIHGNFPYFRADEQSGALSGRPQQSDRNVYLDYVSDNNVDTQMIPETRLALGQDGRGGDT
jgi:hypothetical protein